MNSSLEDLKVKIENLSGFKLDKKLITLQAILNSKAEDSGYKLEEYISMLMYDSEPRDLNGLIEDLLVHETYFFRNPEQFKYFESVILDKWYSDFFLKQKATSECYNIASFGCSSGEEPYSLALILASKKNYLTKPEIKIEAIDFSTQIINKAKIGQFSNFRFIDSIIAYNSQYLNKFFDLDNNDYLIKEELKNLIEFQIKNLIDMIELPYIKKYDCIFCRNVLIYFDLEKQKKVISFLERSLNPGGYLFLGDTEALHIYDHSLRSVNFSSALIYQKEY